MIIIIIVRLIIKMIIIITVKKEEFRVQNKIGERRDRTKKLVIIQIITNY